MQGNYNRLYQFDLVVYIDSKCHQQTHFALFFTHMMVKVKYIAASLFATIVSAMFDM